MKIQKKWTTVSTKLDEDQQLLLEQIANEEGKTVSGITKIAIDQFLLQHAVFSNIKWLFTSGMIEKITPEVIENLTPILEKAINSVMKELSNAKEKHPELARLEYQIKIGLTKVNNGINTSLDPKKRGKGRPNKNESKPKGIEALDSVKELKTILETTQSEVDRKQTKVKKI